MRLLQITAYSLTALAAVSLTAQAGEESQQAAVATNQVTSAQIQTTGELLSQELGTEFYLKNNHDQPHAIAELSPQTSTQAEDLLSEEVNLKPLEVAAENELEGSFTCASAHSVTSQTEENATPQQIAQLSNATCPRPQPINLIELPEVEADYAASPSLSIYIPVGYGADNNTIFTSQTYQPDVRVDEGGVYTGGIGVGIGDADELVGLELSYAFETNDDFGDGGFNAKVHRRFANDFSVAAGWNGFLNIGRNDFEQSLYGVATKVFRTRPSLDDPLSRVAVSLGIGNNQFRSEDNFNDGENGVNVFGNVAVRVIRPVSFITEWTGQDLALGLSIAPFKDIPFVITPAVRDIAGIGDGARFVLGWGAAWQF